MAKKEETVDMVDRFAEFKELKNIDKTTMISVLEESFRSVLAKMFGSDENFDVIMNPDKGDCEIYQNLEVNTCAGIRLTQISIGELRIQTRIACDRHDVLSLQVNADVLDAHLLQRSLRDGVTQNQVLQA